MAAGPRRGPRLPPAARPRSGHRLASWPPTRPGATTRWSSPTRSSSPGPADAVVVVVGTTEEIESEGFDRDSPGPARPPGRAGPRGGRGQSGHRRDRQLRRPGRPALARGGPGGTAELVPRPGGRARPGRRPVRPRRARRPAAHHLGRQGASSPPSPRTGRSPTPRARTSVTVPGCGGPRPPAYWFGHGLGYTSWSYESLLRSADAVAGEQAPSGYGCATPASGPGARSSRCTCPGPETSVDRPRRWLAGYAAVDAGPGEAVDADGGLPARAFQHWSAGHRTWRAEEGAFTVLAGR